MMRSLFAGISGLRNHQTRMDVIGNNIANVNTVGFKGSRVNFQDVLSQTLQGSSSAQGNRGGTNPMQVGLGMGLASIDTVFTDGSVQPTGKQTDLAIQGQGFFVLSDGLNQIFTRAGAFDFDSQGNFLVPGTGYKVVGWSADSSGKIDTTKPTGNIQIPVGAAMPAKQSTNITYANNLSADAAIGTTVQAAINVYDSLGNAHKVNQVFYKVANNKWLAASSVLTNGANVSAAGQVKEISFDSNGAITSIKDATLPAAWTTVETTWPTAPATAGQAVSSTLTFWDKGLNERKIEVKMTNDGGGNFTTTLSEGGKVISTTTAASNAWPTSVTIPAPNGAAYTITSITPPTVPAKQNIGGYTTTATNNPLSFQPPMGAASMSLDLKFSTLTQFGGESTIQATDQDGYAAGTLDKTTIDTNGIITGRFTNGKTQTLAQIALATFNNPAGLNKVGENLFVKSTNSGEAQIGPAGSGGRGKFSPGSLEMSNVDLSSEFSNMIITQRGFQANSKIITTTDQMLEELVNLKR